MSENKEPSESKKKLLKNGHEADSIEQQLAACQTAQQEWKEKCMRLTADLANFNKRITKEKAMWSVLARTGVLTPLLSVIDNFDRAIEKEQVSDGIKMIHTALGEFLKQAGVQEVSYDEFNPEMHEALMQVDSEDKKSGEIIEVMQKGYTLGEKILRPAKVSVAK